MFKTLLYMCLLLIAMLPIDTFAAMNIVLIVADDMRPDCIHALGHKQLRTPHLDRLVREGTTFTRATCAYPICVHSRAELLSGRTSFRNGMYTTPSKLDTRLPLWPETMRQGGYRTFYTGKWHTSGRPSTRGIDESVGLFAGGGGRTAPQFDYAGRPVTGYVGWVFQTEDGRKFPERGVGLTPDISAQFADAAIDVIGRQHTQPYFLQVNFTAPHDPRLIPTGYANKYRPEEIELPPNFRSEHGFDHGNLEGRDERLLPTPRVEADVRAELAAYFAVIEHMDAQIGRIVAAIEQAGTLDETLLIFTADHGLALGSHGLVGKQNMYEHTIGVPLIVRGPGVRRDQRSAVACYLRDLYPTVCNWAKLDVPPGLDGRSLVGALSGDTKQMHAEIVGYFANTQRMIRTDRYKFVRYPQANREQLFDLARDPHELHDLSASGEHAAERMTLHEQLSRALQSLGEQ